MSADGPVILGTGRRIATRGRGATQRRTLASRVAEWLASLPPSLRAILLGVAVLHAFALWWGMPASDGWDVDGVAPRDILPGLAASFTPGTYYTYPPLHLLLLAILTLPVTLAAVVHAGTTTIDAVINEILAPSYMTVVSMTARVVTVLMSLGVVVAVAKTASEMAPQERKRGVLIGAAVACALDAPFTYYSHVTNLDVPYLFWATLAVLEFVRAIVRSEPRRLRRAALLAACAVATKDQAYAMFVFAFPVVVLLWALLERAEQRGTLLREALFAAGLASAFVLVADGALINPSGFRARLGFLTGPASQDFAAYASDARGRALVLVDTVAQADLHYPRVIAAFVLAGFVIALGAARKRGLRAILAAAIPFAVAVSFTVAFNIPARRVEPRFTLPQMLLMLGYAGFALERAWNAFDVRSAAVCRLARVGVALVVAIGLYPSLRVCATMLHEPRYDVETWLQAHASSEDVIEVHGLNVYLPRFRPGTLVRRVGTTSTTGRNPMPGVDEVQDRLSAIEQRRPRFVVVNECYVWRYRDPPPDPEALARDGRVWPITVLHDAADRDATSFFRDLLGGRTAYALVHESRIDSRFFPRYELHASLGCPMLVFERKASS